MRSVCSPVTDTRRDFLTVGFMISGRIVHHWPTRATGQVNSGDR